MGKIALIAGASGLVGGHLLRRLLEDPAYEKVLSLGRRPLALPPANSKLKEIVVDFADLRSVPTQLQADHAFCTLGTTIAKAGSKEAFRRVDYDYVLNFAKLALGFGAQGFYGVTTIHADPAARTFYWRVKGEVEQAVIGLGFASVGFARPSLIAEGRQEFRINERLAHWVLKIAGPFLPGPFERYKEVHPDAIAAVLISLARQQAPGARFVESEKIVSEDP